MKYFYIFLLTAANLYLIGQKAVTTASSEAIGASTPSVTSTIINLNPIAGIKFFVIESPNKDFYELYSYDDFKKQNQDLNAKGDEKFINEFIFKNLDESFNKKDVLNKNEFGELNGFIRFNEMLDKFTKTNFDSHYYIILEKKTGKKENKIIHKTGNVIVNGKIKRLDQYFLSDGITSFYGGYTGVIKVSSK